MAEVTVGETTGTGVVHDAHSCWRCGQELAAAEWLARRLGEEFDCPVCALPLLPPDDGDLDEHMAKRNAACQHRGCDTAGNCHSAPEEGWQCWLSAALAAVGAPTPERADGPEPSDTELLDALDRHLSFRGTGYTNAAGETEIDEVHALVINLEAIGDDGAKFEDCVTLRDYARAILATQETATG